MAVNVESPQDARVSTLLGEIVHETQQLVVDQLKLFKVEMKHDLSRMMQALIPLGIGGLTVFTAIILFGIGGAELLCWLAPALPLWAGFLIVGAVIALGGAGLVWAGIAMLRNIKPAETALKGLEENVQWKTKN
jgi:hypothetical protein